MPKFHVHLYATVRVKYENVNAESQGEAVRKAIDAFDPADLRGGEFAEDFTGALVDNVGDDDYAESRSYNADGTPDPVDGRRVAASE